MIKAARLRIEERPKLWGDLKYCRDFGDFDLDFCQNATWERHATGPNGL